MDFRFNIGKRVSVIKKKKLQRLEEANNSESINH